MQSGSYLGIATSLTVRGRRKHVEAAIKENGGGGEAIKKFKNAEPESLRSKLGKLQEVGDLLARSRRAERVRAKPLLTLMLRTTSTCSPPHTALRYSLLRQQRALVALRLEPVVDRASAVGQSRRDFGAYIPS